MAAKPTPPFVALCTELLAPIGNITSRAMFGGHGLYADGLIVGIVADDQLYLKVDDATRPTWQAAGSAPFSYERGDGKPPIAMSYWRAPVEAFDGEHAMAPWARLALEAALRKRLAKPSTARPRRARPIG